jgi:hypothetical protein
MRDHARMNAYSEDLRKKIVEAGLVDANYSMLRQR